MKNCIFCQIAENPIEQEYRIIFSSEEYIGMLVSSPETKGHFIIFPRKHYSKLSEMEDRNGLFKLAIELAESAIKKLRTEAYTLKLNNNVFLFDKNPLHVGHIHIHVIPKYSEEFEKGKLSVIADVLK